MWINYQEYTPITNTYNTSRPHAVVSQSNGNSYTYDANGNQVTRQIGSDAYTLKYDNENRLVEVKKNSTVIATFVYDADGKRMKGTINGVTTYYPFAHYEITGTTVTKYYFAGAQPIAMRQGSELVYLFADHLGSTSVTYRVSDGQTTPQFYYPWGEVRPGPSNGLPADHTYTGQQTVEGIGLMFYNDYPRPVPPPTCWSESRSLPCPVSHRVSHVSHETRPCACLMSHVSTHLKVWT
jgi:YD repeat-containing protein